MLRDVYGDKWTEGLKHYTSFTGKDGKEVPGKTDINNLSEKQIPVTYGAIKPIYEKWVRDNGREGNPTEVNGSGTSENQKLPV